MRGTLSNQTTSTLSTVSEPKTLKEGRMQNARMYKVRKYEVWIDKVPDACSSVYKTSRIQNILMQQEKPFTSSLNTYVQKPAVKRGGGGRSNAIPLTNTQSWNFLKSRGARNRVGIGLSYRPARLIHSLESIPGLHKRLKIRAFSIYQLIRMEMRLKTTLPLFSSSVFPSW